MRFARFATHHVLESYWVEPVPEAIVWLVRLLLVLRYSTSPQDDPQKSIRDNIDALQRISKHGLPRVIPKN